MAASGTGGRRAAAASGSRRAAESNENDDLASSSFPAASPFSLPPRSPLAAIADPGRNPRSAPATPKSAASTPARPSSRVCAASSGVRDRSSSIAASRRVFDLRDLAAAEVPVEVPHFELDEDPKFWMDRNVQVLIRIRPISAAESAVHGQKRCLIQESSQTLSWTGHPETMFTFDHVACETTSQGKLFRVVGLPMVENCMSGYNGCLFAYGQTGSGKTHTMMGELREVDNGFSEDSGLTPRIFEYLFARIKEEEASQSEEKLRYSCKCSFLEIYNEHITDLLEPSSTNLQLREDMKKGVYVENLKECDVTSVKDVLELLLQGVANRKMAATNMNSESSRSHSVFTCVIESRWERDSMTHLRFGRLNLVDLAGSERQKSSGAEGERLKEAANINRSLSTLGLVIMTLVDVANGKNRHVPYRDSRLTFLLQDSLGGNSKTTIVANVSPSICSSSETLSTLKFAQRAKLIQNNAKVNEDASGDVMALQRQIQELKDQLTCLKKHQNLPGSLCYPSSSFQILDSGSANEFSSLCGVDDESCCDPSLLKQKVSHLEAALVGSLRRESAAEAEVRRLEAEIKHLSRLVHLMEGDAQHLRTMLELRNEKLRRLDLLADDLVSSDGYLMDENVALSQEIQLLQEQITKNPQLTQFALENMRLIEQLRILQNYHKQGEREMLLTEISLLRNHFLHILERKYEPSKKLEAQGDEIIKELDNCRKELDACLENNVLLAREVNKLRCELKEYQNSSMTQTHMVALEDEENCMIPGINQLQHDQVEWNFSHFGSNNVQKEFSDAGILTNSMGSLQVQLISETDSAKHEGNQQLDLLNKKACELTDPRRKSECGGGLSECYSRALDASHNELGKAIVLNEQIEHNSALKFIRQDKAWLYQQETEIGNSQKKLAGDELVLLKSINQQLQEQLVIMAEENTKLTDIIAAKDVQIVSLSEEWEAAIVDLTSFLIDGCRSLDDAYQNVDNMVNSFPQSNNSVSEHIEKAIKLSIEKEKMISRLRIELQDAQIIGRELKEKLGILRGATLAITEAQQLENDGSSKETLQLIDLLHQKDSTIQELENNMKHKDGLFAAAEENSHDALLLPDNRYNMDAAEPLDLEVGSMANQTDPKYQPKLNSVLQLVEDKSNKALSLLSNFEKAQETMEEAERMLSALLKANEEAKHERDACKQDVEMLLAEKTTLIDELHELEASNSSTVQKYEILHGQINGCLAEMTKLVTLMKGSFQQIQMITSEELVALCSEVITFGQELRRWMGDARSYLSNMISLVREKESTYFVQVHQLNANSSALECRQVEPCSEQKDIRNSKFYDEIQAVRNINSVPLVTATNVADGRKEMSSFHSVPQDRTAELEGNSMDLVDDMNVIKDLVFSVALCLDTFMNELACKREVETCTNTAANEQTNDMDSTTGHAKLQNKQVFSTASLRDILKDTWLQTNSLPDQRTGYLKCDRGIIEGEIREQNSGKDLFNDIEHLKHHCAQLIIPLLTFIVDYVTMGKGEARTLHNCQLKTVNGKQLLEMLNKIQNNLLYLIDLFSSMTNYDMKDVRNVSLLNHVFHDICNIERKACALQQRWSSNCSRQADEATDYLSLRREFARKNDIVEGLSFDLKLLQESTSYTKDVKDKTEEILAALSKAQSELEMKTSAMENMLEKQKALEGELAENGAALIILRSEMEQVQSLSFMLSKENNDLRVMLGDEIMKTVETQKLLEDKAKVIEGLERQILFLNSSEEGCLISTIEELNNKLKIISSDRDNLQAEILKLSDRLEMAIALAEEKEALAIEARQAAEISKIYAEEKEEEVKILEHSVEELEATINVLEEEVGNLKEEVRSYQIHKQSETEFQVAEEQILTVENTAKCDAVEDFCSGKCQLQRKLEAMIIALQVARTKIEDLKIEARCKDEEIKQYKDHISELILHSEAQSLLFQEKYQELEHMVSNQKFGPPESTSEMANAKIERPSVRTRGSGSPFRCLSSIVQQMNSEKDQELSVARHRIEELEALVATKRKEVCLLTSRLAAVDSMTHDVIRELLGVKLDMTNYANLLDQEELHKLLITSHQQMEQSKAKDMELQMLKKQFGRLIQERNSLLDDINQRKADILESQMIVEQLEQREQMLEAQNEMLQIEKANLQQKIMEMDETIELLVGSNDVMADTIQNPHGVGDNQQLASSEFSRRLAQSDMLLSHARHEVSRYHTTKSTRTHRDRHQ